MLYPFSACFVKIPKAGLTVTHNIYCHASKSSPLFLLLLRSPQEIVLIWPLRRTAKQRETLVSSGIPSFLSGWSPEWCVAPRPKLLVQGLLERAGTCLASRFVCLTLEIDMIHTCFQCQPSLVSEVLTNLRCHLPGPHAFWFQILIQWFNSDFLVNSSEECPRDSISTKQSHHVLDDS